MGDLDSFAVADSADARRGDPEARRDRERVPAVDMTLSVVGAYRREDLIVSRSGRGAGRGARIGSAGALAHGSL
jgi:hypothetical protein